MQRNIAGTVHDSYKCATSTVGTAIVSFDNGLQLPRTEWFWRYEQEYAVLLPKARS